MAGITVDDSPSSDLLTASRLRAFRKCARFESLEYVRGWRPVHEDDSLAIGSLVHLGLAAWWEADSTNDADAPLVAALAAVAGRATDQWKQILCEELMRGYHARWIGARDRYEVLAIEQEFRAPMLNPETMAPSRTWRLGGKIDGALRVLDPAEQLNGAAVVLEHKTTSEDIAPESDYWTKLQMDHQLSIYIIGAEALGHAVDGALYDVLKKPAIRPLTATPEESRKYTKDGRLYANQREVDETPADFRARMREAIESEPERYFQRRYVPRTESQVRDFLFDAWQQGRAMREAHLASRAPRNPDACHQYGQCPFWRLCSTGALPDDYPAEFQRVPNVHPELAGEEIREEEKGAAA